MKWSKRVKVSIGSMMFCCGKLNKKMGNFFSTPSANDVSGYRLVIIKHDWFLISEDRSRANSSTSYLPGGKGCYPTVDELVKSDSDCERFKALSEILTKDWLLCLPKDTVIRLSEAQSFFFSLSKIDEKNDDLQPTTEKLATKFDSVSNQSRSFASPAPVHVNVPKHDLNLKYDVHELQLKFVAMPEKDVKFPNEKKLKEKEDVESILTKIGISVEISEYHRLGENDKHKTRPILETFRNVRDKRIGFSQAMKNKLSNSDEVLLLPELSPEDKIIEKKLLAKRYDLVKNNGVDKKHLKIRGLKLLRTTNQWMLIDYLLWNWVC